MDFEQNKNQDKGSAGPVIGSIIIIVIIILGGLYFLMQKTSDKAPNPEMTGEDIKQMEDETTENLEAQGTSDEVNDIEADLFDTSLEDLDKELENIDVELSL